MVQDKRVCHLKIINQNNKPNKEKTMKKMTVVLGAIGFALVSLAGELTVTGTGVVKRQPDKMKITFTVSAEDKDMTVARRMFEEHTATLAIGTRGENSTATSLKRTTYSLPRLTGPD